MPHFPCFISWGKLLPQPDKLSTSSTVSTISSVTYRVRYVGHLKCHIFPVLSAGESCCLTRVNYPLAALSAQSAQSHIESDMLDILSATFSLFYQLGKLSTSSTVSMVSSITYQVRYVGHLKCHIFPLLSAGESCCLSRVNYPLAALSVLSAQSHIASDMLDILSATFSLFYQLGKVAASAG